MPMGMGGPPPMGGGGWRRMQYSDEKVKMPKVTKEMLVRIGRYFLPYWKHILLVFVCITVSSLLGLVPSMLTKDIVDKALPGKDMKLLTMLILASFGATILLSLIGVAESFLNTWISTHIIYDMKNKMYKHLEYMSLKFFTTVKPGEIMTRMTSDIGGIQSVFNGTLVSILQNILVLVTTAVTLVSMNWKLAIVGMFVIPMFVAPTRKVGKVRWKIASETQKKVAELNEIIQETLSISGSTLVKLFTKEKEEYDDFEKLNKEVTRLQIKESIAGRWFMMVRRVFTTMGPMLIYFYGGYLFIQDEITVGEIIAFVTLLNRLYGPVQSLSNIHIDITRSLALFERIFEYFDLKHEITDKPDAITMPDIKGLIEFENVSFAYTDQKQTLKNISFTIKPGEMAALVGPSGAGKTTITNLIPRLYDVNGGCVKIDGIDIRDVTLESLRSQIGVVTQDTYLFNDTIKNNLLYARKDATDDELIAACKAANIHDFIMSLPDGYDTIVGNRGVKLSGGEKQRVSIARVILKNPRIVILDEATSSLDSMSEALIQDAIQPLLENRTCIAIAHRLSTVIAADHIFVIKDGELVEAGKHEELVKKGGVYKELYDTQFKGKVHELPEEIRTEYMKLPAKRRVWNMKYPKK